MLGFKNLIEVSAYFEDTDRATEYLISKRWPTGVRCAHCNHAKVYTLKGANKRFKCAQCRKQFSAIKGTIFENSPLSLQKWFTAIYLITSHKKGISSYQLGRDLSISQPAAWFVLHRVRHTLRSGTFEHTKDAIIEIDETFVGGDTKNMHEYKKVKNDKGHTVSQKVPVLGILERGGDVTAKVIPNIFKSTLLPEIYNTVKYGTKIMTDDYPGYKDLCIDYEHETVKHKDREYVRGNIYTNGIENFWSLFHRGVVGIYHHVSPKHLDQYLDEFEFRFNTRKFTERDRFDKMLSKCNRRLTYAQLTDNGKDEDFIKFRPEHE